MFALFVWEDLDSFMVLHLTYDLDIWLCNQGSPKWWWSKLKKCNAKSMFYTFEEWNQRLIHLCINQSVYIGISLNLMIVQVILTTGLRI